MLLPRILRAELLRRFVAAGSAALIFALTLFAASPAAHERLHACEHHTTTVEDGCAIVLFANGVAPALDALAIAPPQATARDFTPATAAEIFLITPRYLRQPERGPPGRV